MVEIIFHDHLDDEIMDKDFKLEDNFQVAYDHELLPILAPLVLVIKEEIPVNKVDHVIYVLDYKAVVVHVIKETDIENVGTEKPVVVNLGSVNMLVAAVD